ncbi:hypothetical protein COOONC_11100 [Cooperia oncophora]
MSNAFLFRYSMRKRDPQKPRLIKSFHTPFTPIGRGEAQAKGLVAKITLKRLIGMCCLSQKTTSVHRFWVSCLLTNIHSLHKNAIALACYLAKSEYSTVAIIESWLKSKILVESLLGIFVWLHYFQTLFPSLVFSESIADGYETLALDLHCSESSFGLISGHGTLKCGSEKTKQMTECISDLTSCQATCLPMGDSNFSDIA